MYCPSHLRDHVEDASSTFRQETSHNHKYFKLNCGCGSTQFRLMISPQKSVRGNCLTCGNSFTIYDLAYYPAGVKLPGSEEFRELDDPANQAAVYVMFEYGEAEPDMEFDENDVTWCQIFVQRNEGEIEMIFDDETC